MDWKMNSIIAHQMQLRDNRLLELDIIANNKKAGYSTNLAFHELCDLENQRFADINHKANFPRRHNVNP
jgi:hypothetical protein